MIRNQRIFGRALLRLATIAGLLSAIPLFPAKHAHAATPAQDQVSRDFHQTVTLGAGQSVRVEHKFGSVTLKSSFGVIEASNIPRGIHAITGNGAISLADIGGDSFAKTSFGSVMTDRISGNLTVENSNGSVTARNVKGDAEINTSFAAVTLESIGGRISVDNQNGAISVTAMRPSSGCRDISLKTSFSSMRVRIPEGLGYNLTARTSFGRISSDLPVTSTGSTGGDTLNGTIGSGGCQLQLTDSNGNIEIAKAP